MKAAFSFVKIKFDIAVFNLKYGCINAAAILPLKEVIFDVLRIRFSNKVSKVTINESLMCIDN